MDHVTSLLSETQLHWVKRSLIAGFLHHVFHRSHPTPQIGGLSELPNALFCRSPGSCGGLTESVSPTLKAGGLSLPD